MISVNIDLVPHITIISELCLGYVSEIIKQRFVALGINCDIINSRTMTQSNVEKWEHNPNHYFFIYCIFNIPSNITINVNKVIIYQLEQHTNNTLSHHYTKRWTITQVGKFFSMSNLLLDYNTTNIDVTTHHCSVTPLLFPVPIVNKFKTTEKCVQLSPQTSIPRTVKVKYDVVHVGLLNQRRRSILSALGKQFSLFCPNYSIFDHDLQRLYSNAKVLVNLHYYENAILERPRLNEALCSGIRIVSECPTDSDMSICNSYPCITFVDLININSQPITPSATSQLIGAVYASLNDSDNNSKSINKLTETTVEKLEQEFNTTFDALFNVKSLMIQKGEVCVIYPDTHDRYINTYNNYEYFAWSSVTDDEFSNYAFKNKLNEDKFKKYRFIIWVNCEYYQSSEFGIYLTVFVEALLNLGHKVMCKNVCGGLYCIRGNKIFPEVNILYQK